MVDADHQSPDRSGGQGGDGHARTAAEFDDTVSRVDVEKLHRPAVARHVRRAPAHDPASDMPYGSSRVVELCHAAVTTPPLHDAAQHPLLDAHQVSTALRVRLKSNARHPAHPGFAAHAGVAVHRRAVGAYWSADEHASVLRRTWIGAAGGSRGGTTALCRVSGPGRRCDPLLPRNRVLAG